MIIYEQINNIYSSELYKTLANPVTVNSNRNMKNEHLCSQMSTYFKRHVGFMSKRTFRLC
jgi:hypothetical protein